MEANAKSYDYLLQKLYLNLVRNLIKKNYKPQDILKDLIEIQLENPSTTLKKLESEIKRSFNKIWNDEQNAWEDYTIPEASSQLDDYEVLGNCNKKIGLKLEENDTKTFIKDIKNILSHAKKIDDHFKKISDNLENIVSIITQDDISI